MYKVEVMNIDNEERRGPEYEVNYQDAQENMAMGILAYILFFIPLLLARDSRFAMYHANQGLLLFLTAMLINVVGCIIPVIGWFLIIPLGNLFVLALVIIGIVNAANMRTTPLPIIGKYQIIK
jgi:uncharacterized membrane protein